MTHRAEKVTRPAYGRKSPALAPTVTVTLVTGTQSEGDAPIGVLIVDDDPLVRAGLRMILGGNAAMRVVGEAADGAAGVVAVRTERPDVVLMDIRMPVLDGLEATARITKAPAPPKVIVLTTFDADQQVLTALRSGASGFLLKDTPPAQIVDAIVKVAAGEPILSPSVMAQIIATATSAGEDPRTARARAQLEALTERELEIARAIGAGKSNAEIAAELYLSIATVKAHVTRLFTKLGVDNRVQIAIVVHEAGLT